PGGDGDEGLAKFSVIDTPEYESYTIIEHPSLVPDYDGVYDYADYNILQFRESRPLIYQQPPISPRDARLAMYFAALSVPHFTAGYPQRYTLPIHRPMLLEQTCANNGCFTKVRVRSAYSHLEDARTGTSQKDEYVTSAEYEVHTKDGQLQEVEAAFF